MHLVLYPTKLAGLRTFDWWLRRERSSCKCTVLKFCATHPSSSTIVASCQPKSPRTCGTITAISSPQITVLTSSSIRRNVVTIPIPRERASGSQGLPLQCVHRLAFDVVTCYSTCVSHSLFYVYTANQVHAYNFVAKHIHQYRHMAQERKMCTTISLMQLSPMSHHRMRMTLLLASLRFTTFTAPSNLTLFLLFCCKYFPFI